MSPALDLTAVRDCHQRAGRVAIDYLSDHDADLLQAYHRYVGELLTLLEEAAERADSERGGA